MPKPQYNVNLTDTGSKNYYKVVGYNQQPPKVYNWSSMPQKVYSPMPNLPAPIPRVNPLKNWWNSIVNNARQNAFAPANTWDTVAPNVPKYNTNTVQANTGLWDTVTWTPSNPKPVPQPGYSIFDPFGITQNAGGMFQGTLPNNVAYGTNTRKARGYPTQPSGSVLNLVNNLNRGQNSPFAKPGAYPAPNPNAAQQYSDTGGGSTGEEYMSLNTLVNMGLVDPNSHDPYEIGGSPYQTGPWVRNPEMPAGGGYGGYGGGSYDYFSKPSSPSYTGYGGSGYLSMPSSPNYTGYGNGYYSMPSSGGYGGGYGGSGYLSMPQAPNYTGYGGNGYASMPQAPTYRGRGGRNQSIAPATAYYRGINSGGGYGGGYAGGQSQRSAWYGALLQWNI